MPGGVEVHVLGVSSQDALHLVDRAGMVPATAPDPRTLQRVQLKKSHLCNLRAAHTITSQVHADKQQSKSEANTSRLLIHPHLMPMHFDAKNDFCFTVSNAAIIERLHKASTDTHAILILTQLQLLHCDGCTSASESEY